MNKPLTDKLYLNLSASQARKRLKGHGFGVKRVQAAGRNQSVIVHTATGAHFQELKSLFADAMPSGSEEALGLPVENLRNLGPTSAAWLREIGVHTKADLKQLGPVLAYQLVKQRQPHTSLNLLWAMAGALGEKDWRDLTFAEKQALKLQIDEE